MSSSLVRSGCIVSCHQSAKEFGELGFDESATVSPLEALDYVHRVTVKFGCEPDERFQRIILAFGVYEFVTLVDDPFGKELASQYVSLEMPPESLVQLLAVIKV